MPRRPAIFTQADLYRAAVAAKRAGMEAVASADGTIRFVQKGEKLPEIALLSLGGIHPWCHESVLPFHAAATPLYTPLP